MKAFKRERGNKTKNKKYEKEIKKMEYTENYLNSIDEALADEAFVEKLAKAESKEQFRTLFLNEKGIELEDEAAQAAFDKIENIKNGGELSAEDLEEVAGGSLLGSFMQAGAATGASWGTQLWGAGFGTLLGGVVGARIARNIFFGRF